ncbi:hypothetical protein [Kitasatospora sp. LaBMicrA B282]|uniref:hypothetical protein n=1 Tax=Kitasatospora sp. LaBMicrA B282 TaxID=3420949 RepID=UPI003D0B1606
MTLTMLLLTVPPVLALLLNLTDPARRRPRRRGRHAAPARARTRRTASVGSS